MEDGRPTAYPDYKSLTSGSRRQEFLRKDKMTNNLSFTLFPSACPTGDTSGCEVPLPDLISKRAYELLEQNGRHINHDLDNWLEAEHEIKRHLGL